MMNILENYGEVLLQQHEGNRQIAAVLARGARVLARRFVKLLTAMRDRAPGEHPFN